MTADQQPDPSRPPADEAPATPPPSSLPAGARGTPLPGALPAWPPPPARHVPPPGRPPGPPSGSLPGFSGFSGPPPAYHGVAPWPPPPPARRRNATGVAALALGVVAASLCWTVYLSPLSLVLGALAVGCGLVGSGRARRGAADNRPVALGGLWIGAGAAVVGAVLSVVLVVDLARVVRVETEVGSAYLAEPGDDVAYADGLVVHAARVEAGEGREAVVRLTVTNETGGEISLAGDALRAFHDGRELPDGDVHRAADAPERVAAGGSADVEYRVAVRADMDALAVDYRPDDDHDWAYWFMAMPDQRDVDREPRDPGAEDGDPPGASLDV